MTKCVILRRIFVNSRVKPSVLWKHLKTKKIFLNTPFSSIEYKIPEFKISVVPAKFQVNMIDYINFSFYQYNIIRYHVKCNSRVKNYNKNSKNKFHAPSPDCCIIKNIYYLNF